MRVSSKVLFRANEDCSPGDCTSDSSDKLLQVSRGDGQYIREFGEQEIHAIKHIFFQVSGCLVAGSWRETFHSWQRSWGRRLGIRKGGIEPWECPRIFSSIYPQKNRVCLLYCLVLSPLTLLGAVPHHHLALSVKELTYSSN